MQNRGIDRLAAMWQAGHPDTTDPHNWMDEETWGTENLVPFRKANGALFTSKDVREWENWGYSYEDTSKITNRNELVSRIDALYDDDHKPVESFRATEFSAAGFSAAGSSAAGFSVAGFSAAGFSMGVETKPSSDMISNPDVPKFSPLTPDYVFTCSFPS